MPGGPNAHLLECDNMRCLKRLSAVCIHSDSNAQVCSWLKRMMHLHALCALPSSSVLLECVPIQVLKRAAG